MGNALDGSLLSCAATDKPGPTIEEERNVKQMRQVDTSLQPAVASADPPASTAVLPIIISPFDLVSKWTLSMPTILGNDDERRQLKEQLLELEKRRSTEQEQNAKLYQENIAGLESQVSRVRDDVDPMTGRTPFFYAVANKNRKSTMLLIESGANVNAADNNGISPLMMACLNRDMDVVKVICDAGGDVRGQDKNGWTALHYAAYSGANDVCTLLLFNGANVLAADKNGKIAADVARSRLHNVTLGVLQRANPNTLTNALNRSVTFRTGNVSEPVKAADGALADVAGTGPLLSIGTTTPSKSPLTWFRLSSKQQPPTPTPTPKPGTAWQ